MDDEPETESTPDSQRRTVIRSAAAAAFVSMAGSSAVSAQGQGRVQDQNQDREADPDHEQAAQMLREFYDGYLEGISHAVATEVQMEALTIEDGRNEPWPLAVWDDVEDARHHGIDLGAGEGGSQPFWDEYNSFDRGYDGGTGDGTVPESDDGIDVERLGADADSDTSSSSNSSTAPDTGASGEADD